MIRVKRKTNLNHKKTDIKKKMVEKVDSEVEEYDENSDEDDTRIWSSEKESDGDEGNGEESNSEIEENNSDEEDLTDIASEDTEHKKSLQKLAETDPEFYKFLEENDKELLNFNLSDEDIDEDNEPDVHVPQLGSDESDYETESIEIYMQERTNMRRMELEEAWNLKKYEWERRYYLKSSKGDGARRDLPLLAPSLSYDDHAGDNENNISFKLLKKWQDSIKTDKSNKTLNELSQAFHAALLLVLPEEEGGLPTNYKVEGSAMFNGVIQLCVLEFGPAIKRFLGLESGSKEKPHQCKKFKKVKKILKCYFEDLLKLLSGVASANIQTVLLKHLHYMSSMLTSFPNITKDIIKQLIKIWGVSDEGVRVIAFFCILKIARNTQPLLDLTLKTMFITYVKNSKFVSPSSLPCINFMRRSLVEMFSLDLNMAYQHVFLYIRQLAIHLRNAMTVNKKENIQAVYNWQFVNSLHLWGNLLSVTYNRPQMQQLVYPFVQVCLGTLRLVPTTQYYPLRFHVTQILIHLSRDADVFIPVLPFIVDILDNYDFNKKHQKVSMRPLKFTFVLRLSKSQLLENGFKDTLVDTIYDQLLEYMTIQSNSISFVELSLLTRIQIKKFLKKCKNANYVKKMKQVLEKIEQNAHFIENERKKVTLNLTDFKQVEGFENQLKLNGTPLSTYYESWNKIRNEKKRKEATNNDELGEYNLHKFKKQKVKHNEVKRKNKDVDFVLTDSEDDGDSQILRKKVNKESA